MIWLVWTLVATVGLAVILAQCTFHVGRQIGREEGRRFERAYTRQRRTHLYTDG